MSQDTNHAFMPGDKVELTRYTSKKESPTVIAIPTKGNMILVGWVNDPGHSYCWSVKEYSERLLNNGPSNRVPDITKYQYAWWAEYREITKTKAARSNAATEGLNCNKCHGYFPYAEPNQPDNTLICWNCKSYPFYKSNL